MLALASPSGCVELSTRWPSLIDLKNGIALKSRHIFNFAGRLKSVDPGHNLSTFGHEAPLKIP